MAAASIAFFRLVDKAREAGSHDGHRGISPDPGRYQTVTSNT